MWLVVCALLHKTPLVQPQPAGLSWPAHRRRHRVHSPSRSTVVKTPRIWPPTVSGPPVHVRLFTWHHLPSHASARETLRLAHALGNTFRDYIALQAFHKVFWQISDGLAPSSRSLRLGCTLRGLCSLRPLSCVGYIFLPVSSCLIRSAARHYILTASTKVNWKWCVYAVTVHVCAVKRLHTTYLGLKINNFVTHHTFYYY